MTNFNDELKKRHAESQKSIYADEEPEIIEKNGCIRERFGLYTYEITDKMIEALKDGKAIALDIGSEYTALIWRQEGE